MGHHCDFPKFYEAMSLFAIAARVNGDMEREADFLMGIYACGADDLDESTVREVLREGNPKVCLAIRQTSVALKAVKSMTASPEADTSTPWAHHSTQVRA